MEDDALTNTLEDRLQSWPREDLVWLARHRGVAPPSPWNLHATRLAALLGRSPSEAEAAALAEHWGARLAYEGWTIAQLDAELRAHNLPGGQTRGGKIDELLAADIRPAAAAQIELDPDQRRFVDRFDEPDLTCAAGPGAGKTTTLCALVARIRAERPKARILVIAYNRNAEETITARLRIFGVKPIPKQRLSSGEPGCYVLTFDKYGFWARNSQSGSSSVDDVYESESASGSGSASESVDEKGQLPIKFSKAPNGFRCALENAVLLPMAAFENWDWILGDEAQDFLPIHARLIEQLSAQAGHLVVAGDPRQEIYNGAAWFSRRWAATSEANRVVLHYNHRSTPEIVNFLNRYSRAHFPLLHHDQIAARQPDGVAFPKSVHYADVSGESFPTRIAAVGDRAGKRLAASTPADAYAITPISVRKWNIEPAINRIRQEIYNVHPATKTVVFDENNNDAVLTPHAFFIGTSYKLKGSERSTVVVLRADVNYDKYIDRSCVIKLIFVAISRARDQLFITHESPIAKTIFAQIVGNTPITAPIAPRPIGEPAKRFSVLAVTDLAALECWGAAADEAPSATFDPPTVEAASDADFVGLFVEAHVATALGTTFGDTMPPKRPARTVGAMPIETLGLVQKTSDSYEFVYDPRKPNACANYDKLAEIYASGHREYAITALRYSIQISQVWTVSERLGGATPNVAAAAIEVSAGLGAEAKDPGFQRRLYCAVCAHRSGVKIGMIAGIADFAPLDGDAVVELKHARPAPSHAAQAGIYAALAGAPTPIVINTKTGETRIVPPIELARVRDVARATFALKNASVIGIRLPFRLPHVAPHEIYIAVGVVMEESLIEIGAIAFSIGTDKIAGVFHEVVDGVIPKADFNEPGSGLEVVDASIAAAGAAETRDRFVEWLEGVAQSRTILYWGATGADPSEPSADSDVPSILGLDGLGCVDMSLAHREWSKCAGGRWYTPPNISLIGAANARFGNFCPFVAQRAFEDAAMIAAIFTAITNVGGVL